MDNYENYLKHRGVVLPDPDSCGVPNYLKEVLIDRKRNLRIMDIGCGYGNMLFGLRNMGFTNLSGMDISQNAVDFCVKQGLNVRIEDIMQYKGEKYEFLIMSHVLEHLPKDKVIPMLRYIRENVLLPGGDLCIMVPNAQSNTDCYWAYEDFTHNTLFTGGSLLFVLRQAGFEKIQLLDVDGLSGMDKNSFAYHKRKMLQEIYITNKLFWNKVTGSSYHLPSPLIFTWEVKALATA